MPIEVATSATLVSNEWLNSMMDQNEQSKSEHLP